MAAEKKIFKSTLLVAPTATGDAVELFRSLNWDSHPLGPVQNWPKALIVSLNILFHTKHPMFIWWGPELFQFYNDAYIPSFGIGKHPLAMGQRGEDCWPEIWSSIKPQIDLVMNEGGATWHENQLMAIFRNGKLEDVYWTYGYSPIYNDDGTVGGTIVVCTETTLSVLHRNRLIEDENNANKTSQKWYSLFMQAPNPMAVFEGPTHKFKFANALYENYFLESSGYIGQTVEDVLPGVKAQGYLEMLNQVYVTGQRCEGKEIFFELLRNDGSVRHFYFNFVYEPIKNISGETEGILTSITDVTEQVLARYKVEDSQNKLKRSEELLSLAAESAGVGLWDLDLKNRTITRNDQFDLIFGAVANNYEWSVETFLSFVHRGDRIYVTRSVLNAVSTKGPFEIECRIIRMDAVVCWVAVSGRVIPNHGGTRPKRMMGKIIDITKVKTAQLEFEKNVDGSPAILWITERDGSCSYFSKQWFAHTGQLSQEALGFGWMQATHQEDRQRVAKTFYAANESRKPYRAECRIRTTSGAFRWAICAGNPRFDLKGKFLGYAGTVFDIHDQKMASKELLMAKDEAENANRSKSAFLANMSHEIRTPLGAILGFTELMKGSNSPIERSDFSEIISRNGKALTRIIDDILDLSKVEAGRLELEKIVFNIQELITEVTDLFKDTAVKKGISLSVKYRSDIPESINSDPTRIRQILINLVGNAIKFTTHGSVEIKVESVVINSKVSQIQFRISDTGVGLSSDQIGRLFEPFTQADNSTTRKYGGSGLGLALSRRLARALGGDVWVQTSRPGMGSVFIASVEAAFELKSKEPVKCFPVTLESVKNRTLKILLVEDSPDNQLLIEKVLSSAGMSVVIAENGLEGVEKANEGNFDVILMDMQMPILDGYSATTRLRESGYDKPVIALTAHAMDEEKAKTHLAGCNAHLTKPLDFDKLVSTISRFANNQYLH